MHILNLLKEAELKRIADQPAYTGWVSNVSKKFGAQKLGFHLEVMEPKTFSAPYHWHTQEEEFFYVIEGEAIVRREDKFRKVGRGDIIFYEVGPQSVHHMYNHTDHPFKFLAVSIAEAKDDQCFYPDSRKQTSPEGILQDGKIVDDFKDEEDPRQYWPEKALRGEV